MFKKLRNRTLLLNMSVTLLVMLTAFGSVYITTWNNIQIENHKKLNNIADTYIFDEAYYSESHDPPILIIPYRISSDYSLSFVVKIDSGGNIINVDSLLDLPDSYYKSAVEMVMRNWNSGLSGSIDLYNSSWLYRIDEGNIFDADYNSDEDESKNSYNYYEEYNAYDENEVYDVYDEYDGYYSISFLDITDSQFTLRGLLFTLVIVGAVMSAVIFFASRYFADRSIKPIAETWEKQKQFVADASHELKTPLTTIMTNCDVLEANENETVKSQREWLDFVKIGANRMKSLINGLLTLARIEGMSVQIEKEYFDSTVLVREIVQSMNILSESKNLTINQDIYQTPELYGYKESIRQILTILYENALKYSNENGTVNITVQITKKLMICAVKNTGDGISPKDLPHIFDRFYRADSSRSGGENSYGLGLAIAKSICEQIDGKIAAQSIPGEWTEFKFTCEITVK